MNYVPWPPPRTSQLLWSFRRTINRKKPQKITVWGVSCDINDMKRKPREMSQLGKKYYWNIKNNSAFRNYDRNTTGRQTEDPRWIYDINKERTTGKFLFKINYSQTCRKMFFSQKKFVIFTHSKFFKQRVNVGFKWNCYCWHKFF